MCKRRSWRFRRLLVDNPEGKQLFFKLPAETARNEAQSSSLASPRRAITAAELRCNSVMHSNGCRNISITLTTNCFDRFLGRWSATLPQPLTQLKDSARCQCDH